jgi:hypothetical protein
MTLPADDFPYESMPIRLVIFDGKKVVKRCFFQAKEHLHRYLQQNSDVIQYEIAVRDGESLTIDTTPKKRNSKKLFSELDDFFNR